MSYSRWSNSHWYTYWLVHTEGRDDAILNIDGAIGHADFTARELREDLDRCMQEVLDSEIEAINDPGNSIEGKPGDIDELKVYVARFLADVDEHFPETSKPKDS